MTTYATVGVGRIQTYLARSRHLWGRRGASEELVRLTVVPGSPQAKADAIPDAELVVQQVLDLFPNAGINDEGLDIDGVVSLRAKNGDTESAHQVQAAAQELALAIRDRLPGLTITVRHITSDARYAELLTPKSKGLWASETWYPLTDEVPVVRLCDECRFSVAVSEVKDHEVRLKLCDDCARRHGGKDRWRKSTMTRGTKKRTQTSDEQAVGAASPARQDDEAYPSRFTAESWLLRRLNEGRTKMLMPSEDFEELGQVERPKDEESELRGRTHEGNHIALIFADGNGMGGLFDALMASAAQETEADSTKRVRDVSKEIKKATSEALLTATKSILFDSDTVCPVVPHINGGDDVLVSVTADRAWEFLNTFLNALSGGFQGLGTQQRPLSMSAGMVICKAEYPLANQSELAEELMRRAKSRVFGQGWSFAWLDVTHDGPEAGAHGVWTLDELRQRTPAIEHLRGAMAAHGESALGAVLTADSQSRATKLAHLARRMQVVSEFLRLVGVDPVDITDEQVARIHDIQSIGRWWR